MQTASMQKIPDTPLWNAKNNRRMWRWYLPSPDAAREASPMHSALPKRIPDTYIETAEFDCLHDEGALYAEKLQSAGAHVEWNDTKGTFHGYDLALRAEIVTRQIEKRIRFLHRNFRQDGV